jgi:hypothetical protein
MTYCTICGKEIPEERMEIVPDTELCVEHAQAIQKYGGEFKLTGIMGNIGKAGSLKKNYGDVDVKKSKNRDAIEKLKKEQEQIP